nr:hypothetical protein [uncultured Desulfobacter sp.]
MAAHPILFRAGDQKAMKSRGICGISGGCRTRCRTGSHQANLRLKNWYVTLGFVPSGSRNFDHRPFEVQFMGFEIF